MRRRCGPRRPRAARAGRRRRRARRAAGGGRDQGRAVFLVVVDDGRSLSPQSIVEAPCAVSARHWVYSEQAPRGTPMRADGSFRWQTDFQVVEGRFSADGRRARAARAATSAGRATTAARRPPRSPAASCGAPRPTGRASRCPRDGWLVSVYVRNTGCTRATRVVDAWRLDRDCVTTSLELRPCRAAGRRCTPVSGGTLKPLAGVACPAGRSRIELVIREECGQLAFSLAADGDQRELRRRAGGRAGLAAPALRGALHRRAGAAGGPGR